MIIKGQLSNENIILKLRHNRLCEIRQPDIRSPTNQTTTITTFSISKEIQKIKRL